ncbi:hypothetical protein Sp245p_26395 (plasmid) [Azospirillum baldaniorum]|nr:hypothetical protein Sp245p_26395 [Azospirillum baldaniorum]
MRFDQGVRLLRRQAGRDVSVRAVDRHPFVAPIADHDEPSVVSLPALCRRSGRRGGEAAQFIRGIIHGFDQFIGVQSLVVIERGGEPFEMAGDFDEVLGVLHPPGAAAGAETARAAERRPATLERSNRPSMVTGPLAENSPMKDVPSSADRAS